jgi:2-iminobutanoate/2-iminopropanoate deaminase
MNARGGTGRPRAHPETNSMAGDIDLINPSTMAAPGGHYSHSVAANGLVFVSGQLPIKPDGSKLDQAPFEEQARLVLDNVAQALTAAGSGIDRLVQVRVYVTDIGSWPAFNALYAAWAGAARPARAVVPVPQLHYGFKIEVEAVALQNAR